MRVDWTHGPEREPMDVTIDGENIELRDVFGGITLITKEGERLSISMKDSGFEAHYYKYDGPGNAFDAGWFRFNNGSVNDDKPEFSQPVEFVSDRMEAWTRASIIVDSVIEEHPVETYKVGGPFGQGVTITAAEQRVSLTREVAAWLLGLDD